MSKKHKKQQANNQFQQADSADLAEYAVIRRDLIKVAVLALVFFGLILVLYYGFYLNGKLESWFSGFLYF